MALLSLGQTLATAVSVSMLYCIGLIIYRLYLHPLARFPGPKLAAATFWYESYHDLYLDGRFIWAIERMHDSYGPVVRITPNELHIKDLDFFTSVYPGFSVKTDKHPSVSAQTGTTTSTFSTNGHDLHKIRRRAIDPFFSKSMVRELEPRIASKVEALCQRLREFASIGEIVNFSAATAAVSMDVISEYSYGDEMCTNFLDSPDFAATFHKLLIALTEMLAFRRAFPTLTWIMGALPSSLLVKLNPSLKMVVDWQNQLRAEVERIKANFDTNGSEGNSQTIFESLLSNPDLPDAEKTIPRLADEADLLLTAGGETSGRAMAQIVVRVLETPHVLQKLQRELRDAIPDASVMPKLLELEQLPYLTAVIQEGLRMMYGVTTRSPRLHHVPLIYKDWTVPAFTKVASTPYFVCVDADIFPEPSVFSPERWLGSDSKKLAGCLHVFGRGTRSCVGQNLAFAELYLCLAALFRRFELELYGTTIDNINFVRDTFLPSPERGMEGVRIKVNRAMKK